MTFWVHATSSYCTPSGKRGLTHYKEIFYQFSHSSVIFIPLYLLLSLTHVMVEKVLFWGKIFEGVLSTDLHVLRAPESEKYILAFHLCMCVYVYVLVCVCIRVCLCVVNSMTHKQIRAKTSNLVFYICIIYSCFLKILKKQFSVYRGTQIILIRKFLVIELLGI